MVARQVPVSAPIVLEHPCLALLTPGSLLKDSCLCWCMGQGRTWDRAGHGTGQDMGQEGHGAGGGGDFPHALAPIRAATAN